MYIRIAYNPEEKHRQFQATKTVRPQGALTSMS